MSRRLERERPFRVFEKDGFETHISEDNEWLKTKKHDNSSKLWGRVNISEYDRLHEEEKPRYIDRDCSFEHKSQQVGGTCLSTCLAILIEGLTKGERTFNDEQIIEDIRLKVNTGAPRTWSDFLHEHTCGYRLAYCNTDHRKLKYYVPELAEADDLFLVSWYSLNLEEIKEANFEANSDGSIGSSHVVIWWKDEIIDTNKDHGAMHYEKYFADYRYDHMAVKRIFRVVAPWSIHRL